MILIAVLLSIFEFFLHNLFTKANVLPNNTNMLCVRPQYASALLRRTLRPNTPYAWGVLCALLPVAVGAMNIHNVRDRQTSVRHQTRIIA